MSFEAPSQGAPTLLVQGTPAAVNVKADFGARGDGVTDDAAAIQAAIAKAALTGAIVAFPAGTYMVSVPLAFVVGARNVLVGSSNGATTIKRIGGGTVLDWSAGTHVVGSYGSRISDIAFDGNNGAGPVVTIANLSLFRMDRVDIYGNGPNGAAATAIGLKLLSMYDSRFRSVFVTSCGGGAAGSTTTPCVLLDTDLTASNNFNNCQFHDLHIEPGPQDSQLLELRGNGTNPITDNQFYGLKVHGDPATGRPDNAILNLGVNAINNAFFHSVIGFGKSATLGQVELAGGRNIFIAGTFGITAGLAPIYGIRVTGGVNQIHFANFKTPASYGTAAIRVEAAVQNTFVFLPPGNFAGATLLSDGGVRTVLIRLDTNTTDLLFQSNAGLKFAGTGGISFFGNAPVAQSTGFGTPTGAARLINFPGATATLAQCSGAIADLITLLKARGDLGA